MKKLIVVLCMATLILSCSPGETSQTLNGSEANLPEELKGLKIYSVNTRGLGKVRVAILDGKVNSTTYQSGKTTQSVIMVDKRTGDNRVIEVIEIISENDSIIVAKKKR